MLKNGVDGGKAGAGGAAGANGTGGALYKFSTASFSGSVANDDKATIGVSDAPSAVKYDVFFDAGGGAPQSFVSVVLGVAVTNCIASAEKFAEARPHLHVYASPALPVPETAEARIAAPEIVDNGDGTGTATFPLDPDLGAQFYEIGVGD